MYRKAELAKIRVELAIGKLTYLADNGSFHRRNKTWWFENIG